MSDTFDYGQDDPVDPSSFILRHQRATVASALGSLDADPEQAARAIELSDVTGDHPALIYPNLENYEAQHKAMLTSQLLQSNRFLRQYVDADPMHPKLSSDDYANLDTASEFIQKTVGPNRFSEWLKSESLWKNFWEGVGDQPLGASAFRSQKDVDYAIANPVQGAIAGGMASILELVSRPAAGVLNVLAEETGSHELPALLEYLMMKGEGPGFSAGHFNAKLYKTIQESMPGPAKKLGEMAQSIRPWVSEGKEPPAGLHPEIDKLKYEQNKIDLDNLDEALKAAQSSATRERNPEVFASFVRQHTNADISISGDAVARLYGDKVPELDDGVLGWVPGIAEQLETAKATGGDIKVPVADWLAKVDPEIAKEVHDDIRVRPGGITKGEKDRVAEAKEGMEEPPKPDTPLPEPLPQVRTSAGLNPMFSIGDRKLELKRIPEETNAHGQPKIKMPWQENTHNFELLDENGKAVGSINLSATEDGKQLYIDMIQGGPKGGDPNFFGPALMRDILRQLKREFPEAESVTGHRVSGARDKANSYMAPSALPVIKLDEDFGPGHTVDLRNLFDSAQKLDMGFGVEAYYSPLLKDNQLKLDAAIREELTRIAPQMDRVFTPNRLEVPSKPGFQRRGMLTLHTDQPPWITVSLEASDPVGTARHEAIHYLRHFGFFDAAEWGTLERAARDGGWKEKYDINNRYVDATESQKLEEAIAEGYRAWKAGKETSPKAEGAFQKLKDFFENLQLRIKEVLGRDFTWDELFQKVDEGDVGKRESTGPRDPNVFDPRADDINSDKEPTPQPFDRAAAVGMTADQFSRYMKLIEKRHTEDLAASMKRAEAEQAKRQTKEWKENAASVREEVARDINLRPDVAADLFLGNAEYLGGKLSTRPKLDETKLTPEQKAALPKSYYGKNGLNPDDVGNLFGYPSGESMVDRLTQYNQVKMAANMSSKDFVTRAIDMETDRQMEQRYGSLEKSITEEAKDQAISETQLNLLHEETLALALRNGAEGSIDKGQIKSWVQEKFAETPIKAIATDDYLAAAGKSGRAAEMALLKQDFAEAFRAKQQQYLSMTFANEAKAYEKRRAQFDKLAKRYEKREVAGASPEYTDGAHDILMRLGQKVRRSVQDLADSFKLNGYDGLKDLVAEKELQLRELHTPDWLQDPNFRKPLDELTHSEFVEAHDALKAITFNSRNELKVEKAGAKYDLEQTLGEMIEKIKSLGKPKPYPGEEGAIAKQARNYWWGGITVESMLNRLDRDDPRGPFYQFITHHFTEAANYKDRLVKDFQKKISAIGKIEDLDKQVENTLFKNPDTGEFLPMRRRNVLGILQNAGNKNNLMKLTKGYDLKTSQVLDFIHQHTTKEDWDRAQKIGDTFNEIFNMANTMSHNISGVGIQRLPLEPIDTPHGTYPGWYNPIKYDQFMPGKSKRLMGPNALEEEGYYRATTPQGYTKQRTGYIAPIELNLDVVPQRMKQMLHDIAMRPAVLQMSKFFYDNRFERAMTNFYGVHQAKSMIPFLRDIANAPNVKSMTEQLGNQAIEYFRQNTIATLIGFNPGTVMKHGTTAWINSMTEVGALNYLREFKNITAESLSGRADWSMAMEKSEELQRRMRNFSELIEGHGREINIKGANSKFMSLREMVTNAGATPVSISDLLSAVPTWLAEYKTQLAAGADEGMAVSFANRAIRRAHGSSILSNKPAIARTNALGATFSSLYGFFSHMQQKQYEMAWKARDMLAGQRDVSTTVPELMRGMFSYVIAPAIIEELVTPYTNNEHDSWGMKAAKTLAMGVSSSFIGARDFVRAAINLRDPQAGLIGTSIKTGTDLFRDLGKGGQAFTKEKAGNLIRHTFALNGVLTGLTNEQEGKMAEYMFNYFNGKERPKGPWDAAVGLRFGKTDKHSRSFEEWKKHTIGK